MLVFSKKAKGSFPEFKSVVAAVEKASKGGTVSEFDIVEAKGFCAIL